jgi:hypothetical protein
MALILTQQIPPTNIAGATIPAVVVVDGSGSTPADTVSTQYPSVKWIVTVISATQARMFEVAALHRSGTNPTFTVYSDIGDRIPLTVDVVIDTSNLVLQISNTSSTPFELSVVRILTT